MKKIKIGDFIVHALSAIVCISFAVIGAVMDMPTWINVFGGFCGGICGILAATTIIHAYTHRNPNKAGAKMADKIITFAEKTPELNTNAERAAFLLAMVDIFNTAAKKYTAPPTDIMDFLKKCGGIDNKKAGVCYRGTEGTYKLHTSTA